MLKKLSKQESLSDFLAIIKPGIKLSDFQWDRVYQTVLQYPEDAKADPGKYEQCFVQISF